MTRFAMVAGICLLAWVFEACQSTKGTVEPKGQKETVDELTSANGETKADSESDSIPEWVAKKGPYRPERTKKHDLLHTKLEVRFDWRKQHLLGTATLTLRPYFYPQKTLQLDAKGFELKRIQWIDAKTGKGTNLVFTYDKRIIDIQLNKTYTRDEKYTLLIEYIAKPNELPLGGSEAITSDKGLYFINPYGSEPNKPQQIWTQGETEASSCWFPTIDSPNEKTTQEIYITVDQKYTTLSNGLLVYSRTNKDGSKTDYWKQDKPHSPYLFMMAVGEFAVVKDKWEGLDVNYYVEPDYEKYAKAIFGRTPEMISFFSKTLNYKYPWDKYSQVVVRDFVSGAMENTGAVTFMEAVQSDKRQLLDENWDNIIAHELFHHWFGDLVTAESWANLPLNESFANYSEYLWTEYKYGLDEADYHGQTEADQYFAEAESKQEPLIRYNHLDKEEMFDSHSYAKGGRILHMLRKYVGDEAFFKALNLYLNQHKYSDAEVHDLRLAFEETTGEDLNWFFNQWFLAAGHPDLLVNHTYEDGKVILTVEQKQDSAYTPIYRLPLKADIWVNGKRTRHDFEVRQARQRFEFPVAAKPDLVLFDAETQLLGLIAHTKPENEWIYQYYNSDRYLARYQAFNEVFGVVRTEENAADTGDKKQAEKSAKLDNAVLQKLAIDALNDPFWVIRQMAVRNFTDAGAKTDLVEEKLKLMAVKDPRSYVRSEAINALFSAKGKLHQEIYKQGLQDSSYTVVASALYAYLTSNPPDAAQQIAAVEAFPNTDIVLVMANYFAETGESARYDWFVQKLKTGSNQLLYTLVQLFGKYLIKSPVETQKKGAQELADAAGKGSAEVRFAVYQTLGMLKEVEGVAELRQDIKQRETDAQLRELYDMVP